jgi:hypothetical protein
VIILSLAVFDRVKAEGLGAAQDEVARKREELPWERQEPMESHADVPKR